MSTRSQEARSLEAAWRFLLDLSSGKQKMRPAADVRARARDITRHYPLAAGARWNELHEGDE